MTTDLAVTPAGASPQRWATRLAGARLVTTGRLGRTAGPTRLVVVAAHPDDETIGAGRLLAAWSRRGWPVTAVLATAGEACFDHVGPRPVGLAERRIAEWNDALDVFGVRDRQLLGRPDGRLGEGQDALVEDVTAVLRSRAEAEDTVVVAPVVHDPHPDHQAIGRAAEVAAARLGLPCYGFPIWLTYWSDPDAVPLPPVWRLITEAADDQIRERALACFPSQLEPWTDELGAVVPADLLDHHRDQLLFPGQEPTS